MCSCSGSCNCNSTTIPRGPQGTPGTNGTNGTNGITATVDVGDVTTGLPGTPVIITNSGLTPSDAIFDFTIPAGATGPAGAASAVTVKDAQGTTVVNCTEIRFTDVNADVTDLGNGIAQVTFIPPTTVWQNVLGLDYYTTNSDTNLFRPQYTIEGNKITFRGYLYIPLKSGGGTVSITDYDSYRGVSGVVLGDADLSVVSNANTALGELQGRFLTNDVVSSKNFPTGAIPQQRDIIFDNVEAIRRYASSSILYTYRSIVQIRIGGVNTEYYNANGTRRGIGCISVYSPFQTQYAGGGYAPFGSDPFSLLISNVTASDPSNNYIAATDDSPWTVPATGGLNPTTVNAHNITNLGGFIINLEGLSGYLN